MTTTREQRADALDRWADDVNTDELVEARTAALRTIAELVEQRDDVYTSLARRHPRRPQFRSVMV